jgi:cellulose synthase/poly-beta-1,6-N-acetylglucosamine synthase-like glycosyltransferase/peptidoglycan/xylan/chitin deacetylase (PgdA/CDA1 family)
MANKPIFFDASGKRAARLTVIGWIAGGLSILLGAGFVASLLAVPNEAAFSLPGARLTAIHTPELENKAVAPGLLKSAEQLAVAARAKKLERQRGRRLAKEQERRRAKASTLLPQQGRPLSTAFYPNWEPSAYDSLKVALPQLDWVMPTWISLQGPTLAFHDGYNQKVYDLIRRNKKSVAILPVVQNATLGQWDGTGMAALLADRTRRQALVKQLTDYMGQHKLDGIISDIESLPDSAYGDYGTFLKELTASFKPRGWIVVLASPVSNDKWPWAAYANDTDYMMLMAYDEHTTPHAPGSIAGQSWFETIVDKRMKSLNPEKTIIALGSYAYDWNEDDVDSLAFEEAVIAAHDSSAEIDFDDATNNPHFSYTEDDGTVHDVWLLDAVTAYNQIHAADVYHPAGYAVWRLGSEDPSIWSVMGRPYGAAAPDDLRQIPVIEDIDFEGQGEIFQVEAHPQSGARTFETDKEFGDITDENYTKLPTGWVIRQFGAAKKKIALTFDDGPDEEWTPRILDILKEKHVTGTFFVIGGNAEAYPGIVTQELADGNEIGNHTFTHPNLTDTPPEAVPIELNATQRLIQALTGRSMRLFRPPYLGDAEPTDADEIEPVETAQNMGYIAVGEHVDPVDWELPGVDKIVQRTLDQVHGAKSDSPRNIILLHDAGGDRSQTVAALPIIIDRLKAEGYQFVSVSDLAGMTRDQAMPPLSPTMALLTDRVVFLALSAVGHVLYICFLIAIWLGISRLFFLAGLSLWNLRRERVAFDAPPKASPYTVSVVIPAYNEENVIVTTVAGILNCTYKDLNVIVIDDGSQDKTVEILSASYGKDPRVEIISIPNGGKANALNVALTKAKGEIIVALDADTQFNRDTIARLVRWFVDPEIGAVAGNAKVGNRINMITRWQALEYVVAQNLERRALAALGTLTVIPGAVGAWRRSILLELGGFPADTLAEDQDLTIAVQRAGYGVMFDSSAIAWTEAPATVSGLAKQRFRWAYGTLQCLWKYRSMTFNPRYGTLGMIAMPQVWMFQIILTAFAPLADLLLLWQLIWQGLAYLEHGAEFSNADLITVGVYYIVFVVVDLCAAIFGFLMEKRESWSLLWWLPLQRFGYRQIMYYVVVQSIVTALRGPFVGWGKLERKGTVIVKQPQEVSTEV